MVPSQLLANVLIRSNLVWESHQVQRSSSNLVQFGRGMKSRPIAVRCILAVTVVLGPLAIRGSVAQAGESWSNAALIPGISQLTNGQSAGSGFISCNSPGHCSVIGSYTIPEATQGIGNGEMALYGLTESNGKWGKPVEIPGQSVPSLSIPEGISCSSPGNCGAVAYSTPIALAGNSSFTAQVVDETNGSWGQLESIPGPASVLSNSEASSISCTSPGDCSATGTNYVGGSSTAFVATEVGGVWGDASQVQGFPTFPATSLGQDNGPQTDTISCSSSGNCSAGGWYTINGADGFSFVVNEVDGTWAGEVMLNGVTTFTTSGSSEVKAVVCNTNGNCSATGTYEGDNSSQGVNGLFEASEVNGTWSDTVSLQGSVATDSLPTIVSMSCSSVGNCSAGGHFESTNIEPFVVNESNGSWGSAEEVPGIEKLNNAPSGSSIGASINQVSCYLPGNCGAVGYFSNSSKVQEAFVVSEIGGVWGGAIIVPGVRSLGAASQLSTVSCVRSGSCIALGGVAKAANSTYQPFVTSYGETSSVKAKRVTITCQRGKAKRRITALRPRCPAGFKKIK